MEVNQVYLGDCLEVMKAFPADSVDMILCDLPYGVLDCRWDKTLPFDLLWEQYNRLIKKKGAIVLFGTEPFSSKMRLSNLGAYKYDWVWKKSAPSNIAQANRQPMRYHELISVFCKGPTLYNKQMIPRVSRRIAQGQKSGLSAKNHGSEHTSLGVKEFSYSKYDADFKNPSSVLEFHAIRAGNKEFCKHATQKPIKLCEYLIRTYTNEGDVVLDNCCGSGSTLVAAKRTGRKWVGIEKEQQYYELTLQRIAAG